MDGWGRDDEWGGEPNMKDGLNPRQRLFCELYAGQGDWFGNGTRAYVIAYNLKCPIDVEYRDLKQTEMTEYNTASAEAARLLRNVKVQKKCNELLDKLVEDEIVDRELAFTIMQRDELSPKVAAIKEYNAVRKRVDQPKNNFNFYGWDKFTDKDNNILSENMDKAPTRKPKKVEGGGRS